MKKNSPSTWNLKWCRWCCSRNEEPDLTLGWIQAWNWNLFSVGNIWVRNPNICNHHIGRQSRDIPSPNSEIEVCLFGESSHPCCIQYITANCRQAMLQITLCSTVPWFPLQSTAVKSEHQARFTSPLKHFYPWLSLIIKYLSRYEMDCHEDEC